MLDILKIIFCIPFLLYSCYSDIKTRRVTNYVWYIMLAGGVFFILNDFSKDGIAYLLRLFISVGLTFVFFFLYSLINSTLHIREIGGADIKLLIVLSILFPVYPTFQAGGHVFPQNMPLNFFVFSVLGDAVTVAIMIPIGLAVRNLMKMGLNIDKLTYIFLGYKTRISELANKHVWILQDFELVNGKVKTIYRRSGLETDDKTINKFKDLLEKGLINDEIWVTPKLPFMIPLTLGFFVAVFYGDLIFELTKYLVFRN